MLVILLVGLGLIIGPLLGIVVDRAVERERPEFLHRCQQCGSGLGLSALVPVLGWKTRCQTDQNHPRWRYPLIDLATAVTFAVAGVRFGASWMLAPYLLFFASLVVMSVIDVETHLLLNILTFPAFAIGLFLVLTLSGPQDHADAMWPALVGAAVFGGVILSAFIVYPPGMGLGDAKLAPTLGLFLGWLTTSPLLAVRLALYSLIIGLLGAALVGLGLRATKVLGQKAEIPMGPGLAIGTVVVIAFSERLTSF